MGKNDDRKHVHDLAVFALKVLKILDNQDDWNDSQMIEIGTLAEKMRFGTYDKWSRTPRGTEFKDSWYGAGCTNEVVELPPQPGDHIERDLH